MKKSLLITLLFFFAFNISLRAEDNLLNELASAQLQKADAMTMVDIFSMLYVPRVVTPDDDALFNKELNASQMERIKKYAAAIKVIDPKERMHSCQYEPGLKLKVFQQKNLTLTLLICFNCDLWALASSDDNSQPKAITAYGDAKPLRKELLEIARELYPDNFKNVK